MNSKDVTLIIQYVRIRSEPFFATIDVTRAVFYNCRNSDQGYLDTCKETQRIVKVFLENMLQKVILLQVQVQVQVNQ